MVLLPWTLRGKETPDKPLKFREAHTKEWLVPATALAVAAALAATVETAENTAAAVAADTVATAEMVANMPAVAAADTVPTAAMPVSIAAVAAADTALSERAAMVKLLHKFTIPTSPTIATVD